MQNTKNVLDVNMLRSMDYVFTTSNSPLAFAIDVKQVGFAKAFRQMFKRPRGTHTGRIVTSNIQGILVKEIAEMVPMKDDQKGDLKFHGLGRYQKKVGPWIVAVLRARYYDDDSIRNAAEKHIATQWLTGKMNYDESGCAAQAFPFLQDKEKDFYCSEHSENTDRLFGFSPAGMGTDNVTPWDIQKSSLLTIVYERKF